MYRMDNNQRDVLSRSRKTKLNIIAMLGVKGVSMLISFLYVPLLLHSMSSENYGVWLTLTSLVSWIVIFDIGLGNGLRNKLAEALAHNDELLGRKYISTAYIVIFSVVIVLILIFILLYEYLPWARILNAYDTNEKELNFLVLVVFVSFCFQFVFSLINSILYALQLPALSSFIFLLGQLISYVLVFVLSKLYLVSSLFILGSVVSVIPPLIQLISTFIIFKFKFKSLTPSFKYFEWNKVTDILSLGVKFFIIQIISILLFQTNNLIITHTLGNDYVVQYNIAYKYMHIIVMIFTIIATPLWSATTEAYIKGDILWIKNVLKKMRLVTILMAMGGFLMFLFSDVVYRIWIGDSSVEISRWTTFILYIYAVAMMLYGMYGYIINGIGKLWIQIIMTASLAILYIPFGIFVSQYWGLNGLLALFAIIPLCNYCWARVQYHKLMKSSATGIWNK